MLEFFSSGLIALALEVAGITPAKLNPSQLLTWQGVPLLVLPADSDKVVTAKVEQYLKQLSAQGRVTTEQGIWMQAGQLVLSDRQGTIPRPAASLTKIATTLAALETWGPTHQFETQIAATGTVKDGVLQGDLIVIGGGDPFFVWEEATALSHTLNRMGIRRVTGNLVVGGNFYMNYKLDPLPAGQLLKQGLEGKNVPAKAFVLPAGTPRPQVAIAGTVQLSSTPIPNQIPLIRHQSLPLSQILKEMNVYSNNEMAEMLAQALGGPQAVSQLAAKLAEFPPEEIQLVNGSGLGLENQISPRAACLMFMAVQRYLQPHNLTIADLFPVSGRDRRGTMESRRIPTATVVKTGTLNDVSALAGVMPTRDRGLVWFAIINRGYGIDTFRTQQDRLLQNFLQVWGAASTPPAAITPRLGSTAPSKNLGDLRRNQVLTNVQARF
jgi:D-alanyl-D-alanine carboxypeptidase/D-alanyl-D-alanine-endopeptidase (penicillin-binding protein 4)